MRRLVKKRKEERKERGDGGERMGSRTRKATERKGKKGILYCPAVLSWLEEVNGCGRLQLLVVVVACKQYVGLSLRLPKPNSFEAPQKEVPTAFGWYAHQDKSTAF